MVHQPVSRGFAVFADAWRLLAEISADLRENGSALEVVLHDYTLYKSTFTLLYCNVLHTLFCKIFMPLHVVRSRGYYIYTHIRIVEGN